MQSLFAKPLTLLLILMLLPLQSVMAVSPGVAASVPQTECMHEGDMGMAADDDAMKLDCEHCSSGHACTSGHCTPLSALAVLPAFSYPTISTLTTSSSLADVRFTSQLCTSLFRPPRA
jgi:hypothetical protein